MFNHATIGIVITNANWQIIEFNKCAETQFDYTKEEVLGQPVKLLLPEQYRKAHVHERDVFFGDPHPRRMGEGRDLSACRKDGSFFR